MATYRELLAEAHGIIKEDEDVAKALLTISNKLPKTAPEIDSVLDDKEIKEMDRLEKEINAATKANQDTSELQKELGPLLLKVIGFAL